MVKAAVLVGGAGTRLSPITAYIPKSMIPIAGKPVLEHIVAHLKRDGIDDVILLVSGSDYEIFRNYFGDGNRCGVKLAYSVAPRVGTAGALYMAREQLQGGTFLVYYGDVITEMNLAEMVDFHKAKRADCTVALSRGTPIDYGVGRVRRDGRLVYFEEKPVLKEYPANMGIFVFEPKILEYCKPNTDLAYHVIPQLIKDRLRVYGYVTDKPHYDIGSFKQLDELRKKLGEVKTANS